MPPSIYNADEVETIQAIENRTIYISCPADGIPPPSILWLKDGLPLLDSPFPNIRELSSGRQLEIRNVQLNEEGEYKCQATNAAGQTSKAYNVQVLSKKWIWTLHSILNKSLPVRQQLWNFLASRFCLKFHTGPAVLCNLRTLLSLKDFPVF